MFLQSPPGPCLVSRALQPLPTPWSLLRQPERGLEGVTPRLRERPGETTPRNIRIAGFLPRWELPSSVLNDSSLRAPAASCCWDRDTVTPASGPELWALGSLLLLMASDATAESLRVTTSYNAGINKGVNDKPLERRMKKQPQFPPGCQVRLGPQESPDTPAVSLGWIISWEESLPSEPWEEATAPAQLWERQQPACPGSGGCGDSQPPPGFWKPAPGIRSSAPGLR